VEFGHFVICGCLDRTSGRVASAAIIHRTRLLRNNNPQQQQPPFDVAVTQIEYLFTAPAHQGQRLAQSLLRWIQQKYSQDILILQCVDSLVSWYAKAAEFQSIGFIPWKDDRFHVMAYRYHKNHSMMDATLLIQFVRGLWSWYHEFS
jgi:hypothetical protein